MKMILTCERRAHGYIVNCPMAICMNEEAVLAVVSRRFDCDGKLAQLLPNRRDGHEAICEEDILEILSSWKETFIE